MNRVPTRNNSERSRLMLVNAKKSRKQGIKDSFVKLNANGTILSFNPRGTSFSGLEPRIRGSTLSLFMVCI